MGFSFRKSIGFGPFRVNLSTSGVGVSTGVRGARLSVGPRGTYVTLGTNGIYFRQRIDSAGNGQASTGGQRAPSPIPESVAAFHTASASELIDFTSEEFLSEINDRARTWAMAPFAWALGGALTIAAFWHSAAAGVVPPWNFIPGVACAVLTLVAGIILCGRDRRRRTTPIFYEFNDAAESRFDLIAEALSQLESCNRLWRVVYEQPNYDWKRNAGATSLVNRTRCTVRPSSPPFLETNLELHAVECGPQTLFFLPERILVFERGVYGAIDYDSLSLGIATTRFIEDGGVPPDAEIAEYTWKYVRRDGGPDRRFGDNRELPVAKYATIALTSASGVNIHLQASNGAAAASFAKILQVAADRISREIKAERSGHACSAPGSGMDAHAAARRILGVEPHAGAAEIEGAYRRLSATYEPSRFARKPSWFRALAHERGLEISKAYRTLTGENLEEPSKPTKHDNGAGLSIMRCPHCGVRLQVPARSLAKRLRCPKCGVRLRAPEGPQKSHRFPDTD